MSLALAALLGALFLLNAVPAAAQTTVWSATLTVEETFTSIFFGCANDVPGSECSSTSVLDDDDFTHNGVTYDVTTIQNTTDGNLTIQLNKNIPGGFASFTLEVDGSSIGSPTSASGRDMRWDNTGLSWTVNQQVSLRLVAPDHTLSVNADPPCGSSVPGTSMQPTYSLALEPAPAAETETEYRWVTDSTEGRWLAALSIKPDTGRSGFLSRQNTFAQWRNAYPGFRGFEFRLKDTHSVTKQCTWTFTEDPASPQPPPNTGGTGTGTPPAGGGGGGGAPPPVLSSDATLDSLEIEGASLDFDPGTDTYTVNVYGVTALTLTPTANHPDAEITVNGNTVQRGSSATVPLDDDGETSVEIEVTAENGTTKTYALTVISCPGEQREILSMFHDSTQGDMWEQSGGWNTGNVLDDWHGVKTENGRVTALSLPGNRLSGEVPEALKCFGGLEELRELDLSGNPDLQGELPRGLSELDSLGVLDIRCTGIDVPEELEEWTQSLGEGFRSGCDTQPDDVVSASGDGGCAVGASSESAGASALLAAMLMLLALSRGLRTRSD